MPPSLRYDDLLWESYCTIEGPDCVVAATILTHETRSGTLTRVERPGLLPRHYGPDHATDDVLREEADAIFHEEAAVRYVGGVLEIDLPSVWVRYTIKGLRQATSEFYVPATYRLIPPLTPQKKKPEPPARKVPIDLDQPCQYWRGKTDGNGYPIQPGQKEIYAHRAAWVKAEGPIPPGYRIRRLCAHRTCVNPAHMMLLVPKGAAPSPHVVHSLTRLAREVE